MRKSPPATATAAKKAEPLLAKKTAPVAPETVFDRPSRDAAPTSDAPPPQPDPGHVCPVCGTVAVTGPVYLCYACQHWVGACCRVKETGKPPACKRCQA